MSFELRMTADGSHTVFSSQFNATYHSRHGAVQESRHVFIEAGFHRALEVFECPIHILEVGFGTGLNAQLTLLACEKQGRTVNYTSLEKYPLPPELSQHLNYRTFLGEETGASFDELLNCPWQKTRLVGRFFHLLKLPIALEDFEPTNHFHLVYFDAFAPASAPELWTVAVFDKLYNVIENQGFIVTFCAKGQVKRNLKAAGFRVETLPGPPGKREMVRASKN